MAKTFPKTIMENACIDPFQRRPMTATTQAQVEELSVAWVRYDGT